MAESAHRAARRPGADVSALKGRIFGPNGRPMSPSHTRRRGRIYRYYVTREAIADGYTGPEASANQPLTGASVRAITTGRLCYCPVRREDDEGWSA
jgi:hypothetical protein